jgi:hypothetical protein
MIDNIRKEGLGEDPDVLLNDKHPFLGRGVYEEVHH